MTPFEPEVLSIRMRQGLEVGELRTGEARLEALIANVPGAIYRCSADASWTMELISDEIERISGYPSSAFVGEGGRPFIEVVHPEDRERVLDAVTEATAAGRPFTLEYRIVRNDGEVAWVLERGQIVHGDGGRSWLDGAIFDVTKRRHAEEALRKHEVELVRLEELRSSRARIITAADDARRRLERDLHDGAQQRLVSLSLALKLAESKIDASPDEAKAILARASEELAHALAELRELARGIHPAVLTDKGLVPALESLAARAPLPARVSVEVEGRLPAPVEAAAYYVVCEALANVAKYAAAEAVEVNVALANDHVLVEVVDDGAGGADPARGTGLFGLADRIEALDGRLEIESPAGVGTTVRARIPHA